MSSWEEYKQSRQKKGQTSSSSYNKTSTSNSWEEYKKKRQQQKSDDIAPLTTTVEQPTIQITVQPTVSQATTSQSTTIGPTTAMSDEKKKQLLLQYKNKNVMFPNTSISAMTEEESKEFKQKIAKEEAKAQKKNEKFQKLPYVLKVVDQTLQAPKDRISYILKQGGVGIYGGLSGIVESGTTEAANEIKKGGNQSKLSQTLDVLNEVVKLAGPTPMSLPMPKIEKNNKKEGALANIIGNVNNATTGAVNSIPGKSFIDELMQSVGAFSGNADVASDIVMSAGSKISEPYYKKQEELNEEGKKYGKPTQILGQASNVVGRMAPSIAATYATKNPNVGLATMGLSAKGSATTEALKKGAELDKAVKIGNTKGMVEIGTEMLTGGMNIFGKGAMDDIVEKGIDKAVKNQVANYLAKKGAGIGGEVLEELISDIADTYIDKGTVDPNAKYSLKDFGNTAVTTMLSTLVLNALGGGYTPAAFRNNAIELQQNQAQQNQKQIQQNQPQIQQNMQQEQQNMQEEQQTAPEQENVNLKEKASQEINDAKISEIDKKEMLEALNNIETVTEEDMQAIRSTIAEINKNNMLPTKENYKESQERRQKYAQYKNDTSEYDSSAVKNVLEAIPENRNGKRTVKQWLKAADEIGKIIANESNENVERIAYKSWFELEPNKNITRYDRETKSNASFQKFTSDEWINTINNAVNEARANNQVQDNTQENINNKVQEYLNKTGLSSKMSVNDFINKAEKFTLENESYMTQEQQELYNIIKDIQNRNSVKEEIVDYDNGIWYDDKGIEYSNKFYENELDSAITTDTPNLEKNKLYTKEFGDNFYLFEKTDDGKYTKYMQLKIEGNQDIISYLEEAVKNGELTNIQNINEVVDEYRNRNTNSNGSNLSVKEQARANGQSSRFYREESKSNIRSDSKTSNENSNVKDNEGRTLTKEQQEYFKDSKVRDENGDLLTMYHSTDVDFTIFKYDNLGKTGKAYGEGFYFTDSEKAKNAYGDKTKEVYLDIKKPMEIGKRTMSKSEYKRLIETVNKMTNGTIIADYGSIEDALMDYEYGGDDIDLVNGLKNISGLNNEKFYNLLRDTLGYDGIKANNKTNGEDGNYWIAFNSNQIKDVNNISPTNNPDILKEQYEQLTIEGFNKEPENNLSKENWTKYQEAKKKTNEILKKDGTKIEIEKRKFSKDFINNGYIDLNGKTVKNAAEIADIAQIFRNPKYETFRVIYMKGDTIVGQEAVSSKTPSETKVFTKNDSQAKGLYKIKNRMERLGADGYYLLHNHPTGTAIASNADINTTKVIDKNIKGFLGHVIINSGTYALIQHSNVNGFKDTLVWKDSVKIENYKPDDIDKMMSKELWTNTKITNKEDVLKLAYDLKNNPNYSSLILTDAKQNPRIVLDIPNNFLNMKLDQINGYIRNVARQNGANNAYIATQDANIYEKINFLNTLRDSILYSVNEKGDLIAKQSKTKDDSSNSIFQSYNSMALRANEKIEDIYNSLFETNQTNEKNAQFKNEIAPINGKENTNNIAPVKQDVTNTIANETTKQKQEEAGKKIAQILDKPITKQKEKSRAWAIAKANLIDKGIVFEELSRKTNNRELQGKWDSTLLSEPAAQNAIENPRYNFEGKQQKQISKGLNEIREEVGKNTSEFNKYMYNLLNIDRMTLESRYGIDNKPVFSNDITAEISQKIVDELEQKYPEFKKYAQDVYDYNNANKAELVKDGVISQELSDKLAEIYPHYVPIKRVDKNNLAINVPLDTNRTGINSPLARAKGGTSDINPLFETMAERTRQTYRAGARNSFGVELLNSLNTLQSQENADVENLIDNLGTEETDTELLKEGKNGKNPTFTVFDNGVKKTFEITQDMYEALKPMSKALRDFNNSNLSKGLRKISNFRRAVLTEYNIIFSLTNPIKDTQDVLVNSQHAAKTYSKFPESIVQILSKGYWYKEYVQNGGESNTYFKDGEFVDEPKKTSKIKKILKMPLNGISRLNNIIEMTPRLAEYIASREAGRSVQTSMLDAARVTTNFKAGGDITKTLNRNGATFLNASVQGFQQQVRNIQEANAKGLKGWAVLASKYAIAGIAPTMLMKALWGDDDDYEELQDYVKDNYYIVGKVGDTFIRIPKGRVAATAQKLVSNVTKYVKDGKLDIDSFSSNFWKDLVEDVEFGIDNVAPNNPIDNNILSPIIQAATGKTWYGEDLVPTRLQKKPAAEQTDESIDKFSTWLGEKTGISPYKINYLIDQYSGGVGDVVLPMLTTQAESGAETIGQKMIAPFVDKFSTNATMKSKYPGEFFEKLDKLEIQSNSDKATDEDTTNYKYFQEKSKEMSELYKEKRQIQSDSDLSDSEKFKQVKKVQSQINEIAKKALEDIAPVKQSGDSNTKTIGDTKYYKDTDGTWNKASDKDLDKMGVSLDTYAKYKNDISEMKDKTNKDVTNKQKIEILLNKGYSNKDKKAIYSNSIGSQDDLYSLIKNDIDINDYLKYKTQEFESDKEDDGTTRGKTISGSKKAKVIDYLNDTNMDYDQKLLLLGTQFSLSKSEKREIFDYVDGMSLNESDKLELLNKIKGFTIYKDGTVKW